MAMGEKRTLSGQEGDLISHYLTVAALWKKLEGSPFPSLKSQYNMYLLAFIGRDKDPNFYSKEATINDKDISPSTSRKLCLHHQPQRASCKVHFPLSDSNDPPYYEPGMKNKIKHANRAR
ncbi:hypothetical protein HKD37_14G040050 [Glycine soja]